MLQINMSVHDVYVAKNKKFKKNKKKIVFDEEVVNRCKAQNLIEEHSKCNTNDTSKTENEISVNSTVDEMRNKKRMKRDKRKVLQLNSNADDMNKTASNNETACLVKKQKRNVESEPETPEQTDSGNTEVKKEESIRARKRKKHLKLIEEKKLKSELNMQQKCLNYLSLWKHSRSSWKFEKLKQIWLQQSIYDDARIPNEFWDTVVEYFNHSLGKVKQTILKEAIKVVEDLESVTEVAKEIEVKYERARHIVQNLNE